MPRPRLALLRRTAFTIVAGFIGLLVLGGVLQACGVAPAAPTVTSGPVQPLSETSPTSSAAATTTATATPTPQPVTAAQGLVGKPAPSQGKVHAAPKVVTTSAAARPAPKPAVQQPPAPRPAPKPAPQPVAQPAPKSASYANCAAVKAAAAAPLYRGQPGYSSKLDRDGDGVACET